MAQQEGMSEGRHDFFDMVGHEDERGGTARGREVLNEVEELFASHWVEAGAGFIQYEQLRLGHECSGNQDTLALALGEDGPWALLQMAAMDRAEQPSGSVLVCPARTPPKVDHRVASAGHSVECRLALGH